MQVISNWNKVYIMVIFCFWVLWSFSIPPVYFGFSIFFYQYILLVYLLKKKLIISLSFQCIGFLLTNFEIFFENSSFENI